MRKKHETTHKHKHQDQSSDEETDEKEHETTHKHKHQDQSSIRKLILGNVWRLKKQEIDKKTLEKIVNTFNKEIKTKGLDAHEIHQVVEDFVTRIEKIEAKAPKLRKNRD